MSRNLVVKVTCAEDAPERANQAFTVAAAAVASGAAVSLWLTGEASWWAVPERGANLGLEHATPVPQLLAVVLEGGTVTLCTQCAARRGITDAEIIPGIRIAGAAAFAEEVLQDGAQALVY